MANIKPGRYDPNKPDIELLDFKSKKRFGLKLSGSGALQIGTASQDDSVFIRNVGKRVGDFDEQRSWKGGRGFENFSDNAEGYWDSLNAWTLSSNRAHPTILWQHAKGLRSGLFFLPGSVTWKPLIGSTLYLSSPITPTSFTAVAARMWLRRVGSPGNVTFRIYSNSGGLPGSEILFATASEVDNLSHFLKFAFNTILVSGTTYHISVQGSSGSDANNHWEVGGVAGAGHQSSNGSSWSSSSFSLYYHIGDGVTPRKFFSFFLDEAMYVVDKKLGGTSSSLYINGDRGKATAAGTTTLTDSTKAWASNQWVGAYIKIIRGTGDGQSPRRIISNTTTEITLASNWDIPVATDSEYIIYATEYFTEVASTGLGLVVSQPAIVNRIVYFPQGASVNTRRMIWSGTAHVFSDDGTNKASFVVQFQSAQGLSVARCISTTSALSVAPAQAWGNPPSALVFGTEKIIGSDTGQITGLTSKESYLYIFKSDGVFAADALLNTNSLRGGLEKTPSRFNGYASIVHQQFVFYSWLYSVIRMFGSNHDDIGQDWSGKGLPNGREGAISSFESYMSLLLASVDALSGTSSVMAFDGIGWHEVFRAWDENLRISMVKVQPCEDTRNRTWIDVGGDLVYQEMPFMKGSPWLDSGMKYTHQAVIESSAIDMGTASGLPKYIKELTILSENLGNGNSITVEYQVDDKVGTDEWTRATTVYESPEAVAYLGLENIRKFSYRLILDSADVSNPPKVLGVIPNGYARTPFKMIWTLRCRADNIVSRGRLVKPDELMRWLLDTARFPGKIQMMSQYELAHKFNVIIHPPRMFPYKPASAGQSEESVFTLALEEA